MNFWKYCSGKWTILYRSDRQFKWIELFALKILQFREDKIRSLKLIPSYVCFTMSVHNCVCLQLCQKCLFMVNLLNDLPVVANKW